MFQNVPSPGCWHGLLWPQVAIPDRLLQAESCRSGWHDAAEAAPPSSALALGFDGEM